MSEHVFTMLPPHPPNPHTCKMCSYTTKRKANLERHCMSLHAIPPRIASFGNLCKYCEDDALTTYSKSLSSSEVSDIFGASEDSEDSFDESKIFQVVRMMMTITKAFHLLMMVIFLFGKIFWKKLPPQLPSTLQRVLSKTNN